MNLLVIFFLIFSTFAQDSNQNKIEIIYRFNSLDYGYEVFISDDGNLIIFDRDYFDLEKKSPKTVSGKVLSKEDLRELKKLVIDADVFNLKDEYINSQEMIKERADTITFIIDGRTKKILCSASSLPIKLSRIINKIQQIRKNIRYVKEE